MRLRRLALSRGRPWPELVPAACLVAPLVSGAAALVYYNFARFHSFTEFGLRYQLAGHNQHAPAVGSELSSVRYVAPNALLYLLDPPTLRPAFPFVFANTKIPWAIHWFHLPQIYNAEPLTGMLWAQPFLLFGVLALFLVRTRAPRPAVAGDADSGRPALASWLTLSLAGATVLGIFPAFAIAGSTMRYLVDSAPCGSVLAEMGFWWVLASPRTSRRAAWGVAAVVVGMIAAEVALAVPLSLIGYYGHFPKFNPELFYKMASLFGP